MHLPEFMLWVFCLSCLNFSSQVNTLCGLVPDLSLRNLFSITFDWIKPCMSRWSELTFELVCFRRCTQEPCLFQHSDSRKRDGLLKKEKSSRSEGGGRWVHKFLDPLFLFVYLDSKTLNIIPVPNKTIFRLWYLNNLHILNSIHILIYMLQSVVF